MDAQRRPADFPHDDSPPQHRAGPGHSPVLPLSAPVLPGPGGWRRALIPVPVPPRPCLPAFTGPLAGTALGAGPLAGSVAPSSSGYGRP